MCLTFYVQYERLVFYIYIYICILIIYHLYLTTSSFIIMSFYLL